MGNFLLSSFDEPDADLLYNCSCIHTAEFKTIRVYKAFQEFHK